MLIKFYIQLSKKIGWCGCRVKYILTEIFVILDENLLFLNAV
jgi:hypothetical protein